jgi:hypothetical protein
MPFPSLNSLVKQFFFITNGPTDGQKITDEGFTYGVFLSVISLVNNYQRNDSANTDEIFRR